MEKFAKVCFCCSAVVLLSVLKTAFMLKAVSLIIQVNIDYFKNLFSRNSDLYCIFRHFMSKKFILESLRNHYPEELCICMCMCMIIPHPYLLAYSKL